MRWIHLPIISIAFLSLTGWGHWGPNVKIGLALDKDREPLVKELRTAMEDNRAELLVADAQGDPAAQLKAVRSLIQQGIQTLVVIPVDPAKAQTLVDAAHQAGIKVISLERLIPNSALDHLIDFDNEKAGELQAKAMVKKVPRGRYVLFEGDPAKGASKDFQKGQMKVLQPLIDRGDIQIAASISARAKKTNTLGAFLAREKDPVDAILTPDAETAEEAVQELEKRGLAGKIMVAGSGEDLATCQRVANHTQWLTIYHPPQKLAEETAYLAAKLARKATEFDCQFVKVDNGSQKTQAVLLTPRVVEAQDLRSTVIEDQVQKAEDVFKN